jgi:hypothetical protein
MTKVPSLGYEKVQKALQRDVGWLSARKEAIFAFRSVYSTRSSN